MKQITFRELLDLIYDDKAPKWIKYKHNNDRKYKYMIKDYIDCEGEYLSNVIGDDLFLAQMACDKCITIYDEILDDKEKEYLKAFIKPFRNRVRTIERKNNKEWERIVVFYKDYDDTSDSVRSYMSLPMFEAGTMYKGMELNKEYTVEELGL